MLVVCGGGRFLSNGLPLYLYTFAADAEKRCDTLTNRVEH